MPAITNPKSVLEIIFIIIITINIQKKITSICSWLPKKFKSNKKILVYWVTLSQYHNKKICEKVKSIILLGKGLLSRILFFKNPTILGGPCHVACMNLVSPPGIESGAMAVKVLSPNLWTTRDVPRISQFLYQFFFKEGTWAIHMNWQATVSSNKQMWKDAQLLIYQENIKAHTRNGAVRLKGL